MQFFRKLSLSFDIPMINVVIDLTKSLQYKKAKFLAVKD